MAEKLKPFSKEELEEIYVLEDQANGVFANNPRRGKKRGEKTSAR